MLSVYTKIYVKRRIKASKEKNILVREEYIQVFKPYAILLDNVGYKLKFKKNLLDSKYLLSGSSGFRDSDSIVITPEWAVRKVFYNIKKGLTFCQSFFNKINIIMGIMPSQKN